MTQGLAGKPIVLSGHKHRFLLTIHLPIASVRRLAMVNTETHNAACDKMDLFPQQNRGWNAPEVRSRLVLPRAEAPLPPTPLKLLGTQSSAPEADDRNTDLLIQGLLDRLPTPNTIWSLDDRVKWLRTAASIFGLVYQDSDGEQRELGVVVLKHETDASSITEAIAPGFIGQ